MATLQGPVICPTARAKQVGIYQVPSNAILMKATLLRSGFWGHKRRTNASIRPCSFHVSRRARVRCTFSSSSNGSGSRAENFNENHEDYVDSSVIEAVEVKSGQDGLTVKMRDGKSFKCVHNNPQNGHRPDYAPHPAIVLKVEDGTDQLLPIIVLEMPCMLLMAAIRNVHISRPTMYQVIQDMIEKMGYVVKLVRITKRVHEAYYAMIYLTKVGDESECISFDLRPSDAINIAVRCKVPIQVNKNLIQSDGMKIVEPAKALTYEPASDGGFYAELDRPNGSPCMEATEFNLLRNMLDAAGEERYHEAAQWRDKLTQLRAKKNWA